MLERRDLEGLRRLEGDLDDFLLAGDFDDLRLGDFEVLRRDGFLSDVRSSRLDVSFFLPIDTPRERDRCRRMFLCFSSFLRASTETERDRSLSLDLDRLMLDRLLDDRFSAFSITTAL